MTQEGCRCAASSDDVHLNYVEYIFESTKHVQVLGSWHYLAQARQYLWKSSAAFAAASVNIPGLCGVKDL